MAVAGKLNDYGVVVGGADVSGILLGLNWGGSISDLADRATFRVGVEPRRATALASVLPNGARCDVIANGAVVMQGVVFAVDEVEEPGMRAYEVTAYDPLTYLARSEIDLQTFLNHPPRQIIELVCSLAGFPVGSIALPDTVVFPPKSFIGEKPADIIAFLCDQVGLFTGGVYAPRWDGGLSIVRVGGGSVTAQLSAFNSTRVRSRQDMEDLVTAVKLSGSFAMGGNTSELSPTPGGSQVVDNSPQTPVTPAPITRGQDYLDQFGTLQKVLKTSDFRNEAEARSAAAEILRVNGSPRQEQTFVSFDVPTVRKVDQVSVSQLGSASGNYTVTAVQHDAGSQTMTITSDSRALLHVRAGGAITDPLAIPQTAGGAPIPGVR